MNITTNHATTEQTHPAALSPDWLSDQIRARHLPLENNAIPAEVIPCVQKFIKRHLEIGTQIPQGLDSYPRWKATLDDWQQFLTLLQTFPLPGTAKPQLGEFDKHGTATAPASPTPSKTGTATAPASRKKIEKLEKQIEKQIAKLEPALQQQLAGVLHPSDQASQTRPAPVPDPSQSAPNASQDASDSGDPNPSHTDSKQTPDPKFQTRQEYILLHEPPSKSPIDNLPPERQEIIYGLIQEGYSYMFVAKMIGQPEPVGWNFKTSDTSLKRFWRRYGKKLEAAERAQAFAEAGAAVEQTGANEQTYMDATRRLLKLRLFKNASDPKGSDEQIEFLMRLLDRQRRTDLAERRVHLLEHRATQKENK